MIGRRLLITTLLILAVRGGPAALAFGPGEAAGGSRRANAARGPAGNADFRIVVWYRRDDALGTFKYQVYDVRTGEYSAAVEAWVREIPAKYPAYIVLVRNVDLNREKGETEKLKVGSVIKRELMAAAAMSGIALGEGFRINPAPTSLGPRQTSGLNRSGGVTQTDRSFLNPNPTPFPVPVPYPRPHP
jgi:hypothetical protein